MSICEVKCFEEGYGIDVSEWFVQMLKKKKKRKQCETLTVFFWHLSSSFTACLQPTAADFVPERDQIFLIWTVSFIQEFNFDKIVQEC